MAKEKKIIDDGFISSIWRELGNIDLPLDYIEEELKSSKVFTKDLKVAATQMTLHEARFLVDLYDQVQHNRVRSAAQIRALEKAEGEGETEPHCVIQHFLGNSVSLEAQIKKALEIFAQNHPVGKWIISMHGMGPIMSARILAYIDISECPTAGHIFSYAGLDPTRKWYKNEDEAKEIINRIVGKSKEITNEHLVKVRNETGWSITHLDKFSLPSSWKKKIEPGESEEKEAKPPKNEKRTAECLKKAIMLRPHNAKLKKLCWNIAESFMKQKGRPNSYYGKILTARNEYELAKNEAGEYADEAAKSLAKLKSKNTDTYKANIEGKLTAGHIWNRSRRYAVKRFLSHLQYVWYKYEFQEEPPKPYVITHMGHTDIDYPPNMDIMNFDEEKIKKNTGTIKAMADKVCEAVQKEDIDDLVKEAKLKSVYKEVMKKMKGMLN